MGDGMLEKILHSNKNDFTVCSKYRFMILQLLENGEKTNIPQATRDAAYNLLDEYFKNEE